MNYKTLIAILIALAIGVGVGFYFGESTQLEKCNALVQKVETLFPPTKEMKSVSGTVKEIKDGSIVVDTSKSSNPFENYPTIREVKITSSTTIYVVRPQKNVIPPISSGITTELTTSTVSETSISEKDISVGSPITIISDKDIKADAVINDAKIIRVYAAAVRGAVQK